MAREGVEPPLTVLQTVALPVELPSQMCRHTICTTTMSSILQFQIAARMIMLSMVGMLWPLCHLQTAAALTPQASVTSATVMPALILLSLMLRPVAAISIVGISATSFPSGSSGVSRVRFELTHNCVLNAAPLPIGVPGHTGGGDRTRRTLFLRE